MSFNISYIIEAVDAFSPVAKQIKDSLGEIRKEAEKTGKSIAYTMGKKLKDFGGEMSMKFTAPLVALGTIAIKTAGDLEMLGVSFETMLGSKQKSDALMKGLVTYAAATPFEMPEVGQAAKVLLAFNVSAENVIPTLKMLGDIASGTGTPINELGLIFGKVLAKGKLQAEELNQMSERGIPLMGFLEKILHKSKGEIYKMGEQGKLSSKYVVDAFVQMTSKGGLFYQMTEKQGKSINGLFSTLTDSARIASATIGNIIIDSFDLRDVIPDLSDKVGVFADNVKQWAKANPDLTKMLVIVTGIVAVGMPLISMFGFIAMGIGALISPIGLVIVLVTALTAAFAYFYTTSETFRNSISQIVSALQPLIDLFKFLFDLDSSVRGMVFGAIGDAYKSVSGALADPNAGQMSQLTVGQKPNDSLYSPAVQNIMGTSNANINVNIVDKNNNVGSVKGTTSGNANMNFGKNMAYVR
jgi:tape measure domain-containing protein